MANLDELRMRIIKKALNVKSEDKLLAMLDETKRPRKKFSHGFSHEGFGIKCNMYVWATISGIPPASFERCLINGMTVEEIFEYRQCPPPTEEQKNKVREALKPAKRPVHRIPKDIPPEQSE